jgi:ABC-type nitrate/sulfonate/bicarbonate transport system ATPase subunit
MQVKRLTFAYEGKMVYEDFSLYFPPGEITCILGGSGVGKTTLLHLIAGLLPADQGQISPGVQTISYVFQEPRLLPWLTVLENVEFVLKGSLERKARRQQAVEMLEQVGLGEVLDDFPRQLSGGMRQRVALARAFVIQPELLLLDEPLQGLDVATRQEIRHLFSRLWSQYRPTVIYITHDIQDVLMLGQQVLVFGSQPVQVMFQAHIETPIDKRNEQQGELAILKQLLTMQMLQAQRTLQQRKKMPGVAIDVEQGRREHESYTNAGSFVFSQHG